MLVDYLRRHHVALLALFIALGGTSYAAVQLPRNSVGTPQLQAKAVTSAKLSKKVQKQLATVAAPGPQGPAGAPGGPGPKGDPGVQGIPGPTSAGVGGVNTGVTPTAGVAELSPATVTLGQRGRVLVLATGTFSVQCASPGCTRQISVQVDGTTVPGAFGTVAPSTAGLTSQLINAVGILTDVPAGSHVVTIASRVTGTASATTNGGDVRVVAVALG